MAVNCCVLPAAIEGFDGVTAIDTSTATGTYSDGSTQNLTSSAQWTSSNISVATINSSGNALALSTGNAQITATIPGTGILGQSTITVGPAALVSIAVTPASVSIALGTQQQFAAMGTYTDGSTQDLTASVVWSASDTTIATIGSSGEATSKAIGSTTINAASGSISGSTTLTVTQAALVSIAITPAIPSVPLDETQQFTATGTFTDSSTQDITGTVNWSSSNPAVATISMSDPTRGLAQTAAEGTTTIAASSAGISGNTTLTVTTAVITSIAVTPSPLAFAKGTTQQLLATATYSDNSTRDITSTATWSSGDNTVATVGATGLAAAVQVGNTVITAAASGITGSTSVEVTPAVLVSIAVAPSSESIPLGTTQQFSATGTYSDGSTQTLTSSAQWTSSDATVATISMAQATIGLASSAGTGTATITANSGAVAGTATLTVTPAALISIAVTPPSPAITLGQSQQFTETGTYTDSSSKDITTNVTWSTSNALVAIISNQTGSNGLATSSGAGSTVITAAMGSVSATATLSVGVPQLVSITVTPATPIIPLGTNQQFAATGTYTDNSTANLTNSVTWSSSNTSVAPVNNSGMAASLSEGSTTITASLDAISGGTVLTVVAPAITAVQISPSNPSVPLGMTQQFTATAVYNNSSTQDVTSSATWASLTTMVAAISNTGLATSVAQGSTTIQVTYGGLSASTTLTVTAPGLVSIAVTPTSATASAGSYVRFTATGTYTNSSQANISNLVSWSSSGNSVATVDTTGLASTVTPGTVTITAASGAISGTASLTVVTGTGGGSPRFVYTANAGSYTVSGYIIDQGMGALTPVPGSPTSSNYGAISIATDPTGQHVYVGTYYGVTGFSADPVTGQLTAIAGGNPVFGACCSREYVDSLAVDPTGRFAYAANSYYNSNSVSAYVIDAGNGALTATDGSPFAVGNSPTSVVIDPTGKFVYVGNEGDSTISGFGINQQMGALTALTGSPYTVSGGVEGLAMHASGKFLYAGNGGQVQAYTIDATTGALTVVTGSPFNTGGCCINLNGVATEATGRYLFTANSGSGTVSVFSIDGASGTLTAVTGSPFTVGGDPSALTADVSGTFLYVTDTSTDPGTVEAFTIAGTTGALTAVSGSPFAAGVDPDGVATTGAVAASTATLQSVAISPTNPVLSTNVLGTTQQLLLLGTYSDGTVKSLTESATWTSTTTTVATVSSTAGTKGLVTSVGYGTTTITASYGTLTATATLTVQSPALTAITVTPSAYVIASGTAVQFQATGNYADGSTLNLTTTATWSSSNGTIATVSNTAGSQGLATGVAPGVVTITAASGAISGTASLTVQ